MDASERLSVQLALQQELEAQCEQSLDLLLSGFIASLKCHRRGSVCRPFPTHLQPSQDYAAVVAALDSLPHLSEALAGEPAQDSSMSDQQLQLLQWLLLQLQLKRSCTLSLATQSDLESELQASGCNLPDLQQSLRSCRCIVRLDSGPQQQQARTPGSCLAAYHGTDFANVHSILHNGLLAASGTRLQTTGAIFGCGVYLSSDFNVAYSFCKAREAWANSCIGKHLRCVLLCQVDRSAAVEGRGTDVAGSNRLPEKYVLVPKPGDVMIRYLLVYSDDMLLGHNHSSRRHGGAAVCMFFTAAYTVAMLLLALWQGVRSRGAW